MKVIEKSQPENKVNFAVEGVTSTHNYHTDQTSEVPEHAEIQIETTTNQPIFESLLIDTDQNDDENSLKTYKHGEFNEENTTTEKVKEETFQSTQDEASLETSTVADLGESTPGGKIEEASFQASASKTTPDDELEANQEIETTLANEYEDQSIGWKREFLFEETTAPSIDEENIFTSNEKEIVITNASELDLITTIAPQYLDEVSGQYESSSPQTVSKEFLTTVNEQTYLVDNALPHTIVHKVDLKQNSQQNISRKKMKIKLDLSKVDASQAEIPEYEYGRHALHFNTLPLIYF